jgi:hypothetical protein
VAIAKRCSLLEENAYKFLKKWNLAPGDPPPPGYRAVWQTRHYLAVAKLGDIIDSQTKGEDFAGILLSPGKSRDEDDFIEVHIFGPFNQGAIAAVRGNSNPKQAVERAVVAVVKEFLLQSHQTWIEE